MILYHTAACIKIVVWSIILRLTYRYIDPFQDPIVGIWLAFFWLFILVWWASFYLFLTFEFLFSAKDHLFRIKESYKLSFLFGMYILINIWLIFLEQRTKFLGIILFLWFVALQMFLVLTPNSDVIDEKREF